MLILFVVWQFYLAFSGTTTVEFWKYHASVVSCPYDFSFDLVRDNLFNIFGTYKLVRQFSPSLRQPPLTGLEWSFLLKEKGIGEDGEVPIDSLGQEETAAQLTELQDLAGISADNNQQDDEGSLLTD